MVMKGERKVGWVAWEMSNWMQHLKGKVEFKGWRAGTIHDRYKSLTGKPYYGGVVMLNVRKN